MSGHFDFKIDILENGLDFILDAVEHLGKNSDKRDLKYGILHLAAGVELILKARLRKHDWKLIFSDPKKANINAFNAGDFHSVGLEKCIDCLDEVCINKFSDKQKEILATLKSKRNRIEHLGLTDSVIAIISSTAQVLDFILDFIMTEFVLNDLGTESEGILNQIRSKLSEFDYFVKERLEKISPDLDDLDTEVFTCPRCSQDALILDDGVLCKFCGYSDKGDEAAYEYVKMILGITWKYEADGGIIPVYRCPECWNQSLVDISRLRDSYDGIRFICFGCATKFMWQESDFCPNCGNPFVKNNSENIICEECHLS